MALSILLGLIFIFFTACSTPKAKPVENEHKLQTPTASQEIQEYRQNKQKVLEQIPNIILPPIYEEISVFDDKKITFSAQDAPLYQVLYSLSEISGLNLIIDSDVEKNIPVTLSVKDADLKDVLEIIMNISGCYYDLQGNILHVKQFMRKRFFIPYVHSFTSFSSELGGDTLGSANNGESSSSGGSGSEGGIKGIFKLNFNNPEQSNNFYEHLEENIISLIGTDGKYTLNRFSGILSVYDKKKNVYAIENFIKDVKTKCNQTVLIEAKILEVTLNEGHQLGVDWNYIAKSLTSAGTTLALGQSLGLTKNVTGLVTYRSNSVDFTAAISALNSSGDVETLSNPRIKVLNGQSAIISSGKLVPFWEKEVQTDQGTGGSASNTQVTYNRRDVLDGVTMGVTPTIMEDGKIMLNVIPISSSIEKIIEHKDETGANVASAPLLNIKEAGTIIYAENNDLILIGGLISSSAHDETAEVPLLSAIPLIGTLFTQTNQVIEKKELIILIKLKVIQ